MLESWRRPLEAYESCREGGGRASDAGLGGGEGDVGVLPVLARRLLDQAVVLHLGVGVWEGVCERECVCVCVRESDECVCDYACV